MQKEIGEEGHNLNLSVASRAMNVAPDKEQIEQYDEYKTGVNAIGIVVLLVAAGAIWLDVTLFRTGHWIWGIVVALVALFLLLIGKSLLGATLKKSVAYESGLLVSAIVVNTSPLQILALADMGSDEEQPVVYGCQKMTVETLPGHKLALYEKVPCASLFGMALKGYRRHFEPRPIAWGYADPEMVTQAIAAIDSDVEQDCNNEPLPLLSEWEILRKLEAKMVDATEKEVVFFDSDLNRVEL